MKYHTVSFNNQTTSSTPFTMAPRPTASEQEDVAWDAAFNKVLHGKSAKAQGGFAAMHGKDATAQKAAFDEYFKHWDNQNPADETAEISEVRSA